VTVSPDGPYNVLDEVVFSCELRTDPAVGIQRFIITREGVELLNRDDFTTNGVDFTFTYTTSAEDVDLGSIALDFELIDNNDQQVNQSITIDVTIDFPFSVQTLLPNPGWDLVNNTAVTEAEGTNVDIFLIQQSGPGTSTSYFVSKNDTRFYNITNPDINFFNLAATKEEVLAAIEGLPALDTVLISDINTGSSTINLPIIAQIRGKDTYAIIDFSDPVGVTWAYRKESEFSGQ
jgi:hypothetical protein